MFGKENVDRQLKLDEQKKLRCCYTFGAKLSHEQIFKLQLKGVKHITLFYDIDVINKIKKYALTLLSEFETVKVVFSRDKTKDPADLDLKEMLEVVNNPMDPIKFHFNKVQVLNLK